MRRQEELIMTVWAEHQHTPSPAVLGSVGGVASGWVCAPRLSQVSLAQLVMMCRTTTTTACAP